MDRDDPDTEESDSERLARSRLGRNAQVGGGIAAFIGILLHVFVPAVPAGKPDVNQMAKIFIGIGLSLIAVGTLSRWYFLD